MKTEKNKNSKERFAYSSDLGLSIVSKGEEVKTETKDKSKEKDEK